jgi:hypothetical protein
LVVHADDDLRARLEAVGGFQEAREARAAPGGEGAQALGDGDGVEQGGDAAGGAASTLFRFSQYWLCPRVPSRVT